MIDFSALHWCTSAIYNNEKHSGKEQAHDHGGKPTRGGSPHVFSHSGATVEAFDEQRH